MMDFPLSPLSYFSFSLLVVKPIVPRSLSFAQSLAIKLGGDPVSSGSISRLYSQEHRGVKAFSNVCLFSIWLMEQNCTENWIS